jgi:hypothetical protein
MALDDNEAGPIIDALGDRDRIGDPLAIVGVADPLNVPTIGQKPPGDVLGESESSISLESGVSFVLMYSCLFVARS